MTRRERIRRFAEGSHRLRPWLERYRAIGRRTKVSRFRATLARQMLFPPPEIEAIARDYEAVCHATQVGPGAILHLEYIARYVVDARLEGAFVECGTWRGGALAFWARSYMRNGGDVARHCLYGFDSFDGMPNMTEEDGPHTSRWLYGRELDRIGADDLRGRLVGSKVNRADERECRALLDATGYPEANRFVVKGWFQETLPQWRDRVGPIGVLRLDGDLYESTRVCLDQLYGQVVPGGVVIVDDYGTFDGCRRAVDEWRGRQPLRPGLLPVDIGLRWFVKR